MSDVTAGSRTVAAPGRREPVSHLLRHRVRRRPRWPYRWLLVVFIGYLALGKGFAYFGVPPLFIGEVTLVVLFLAAVRSDLRAPSGPSPMAALLLGMGGLLHAVVDLLYTDIEPVETLRGLAIVYYALFAVLAHGWLTEHERFTSFDETVAAIQRLLLRSVFVVVPILTFLSLRLVGILKWSPKWPGSGIPVLLTKPPDIGVALAFVLPFVRTGLAQARTAAARLARWQVMAAAWAVTALLISARSRAGLIAVFVGIAFTFGFTARTAIRTVGGLVSIYVVLWITGLHLNAGGRTLSARGLTDSLLSIVAPDQASTASFSQTTDWRSRWWTSILHDAWTQRSWFRGPGWGINLARKYGVSSNIDLPQEFVALRLPHNMVIGLIGRVGFVLAGLYVAVPVLALVASRSARLHASLRDQPLRRAVQGGLVAGFAVGLTDVYLESPQGAILFWLFCGTLWWMAAPRGQTRSAIASS